MRIFTASCHDDTSKALTYCTRFQGISVLRAHPAFIRVVSTSIVDILG